MVWIVFSELLPEAVESCPKPYVATAGTFSAASLEGLRMLLQSFEKPDGQLATPIQAESSLIFPAASTLAATAVPMILAAYCSQVGVMNQLLGKPTKGFASGVAVGCKLGIGVMGFLWLVRLKIITTSIAVVLSLAGGVVVIALWKLVMNELSVYNNPTL